ncbi:MAG: hypothetical protein ABI880_12160 [Acidobacteriota bacterium]
MAFAAPPVVPTPGFATMVTPAPAAEAGTVFGTGAHWLSGGVQILLVGLLVPIGILLVGAPIVLLVRGVIALIERF